MEPVNIKSKGGSAIQVKSPKSQSKKRPLGEPIKYDKVPVHDSKNACMQVWLGRFWPHPMWIGRESVRDPKVKIGPLATALMIDEATLRTMVAQIRQELANPKNKLKKGEVHNVRVTELFHVLKKLGWIHTMIIAAIAQIDPYFGESDAYHDAKYDEERAAMKKIRDAQSPVSAESSAAASQDSSVSDERKRRRIDAESVVEVANSNVAPATPATPAVVVAAPAPLPLEGPVPTPEEMAKLAADFASVYARFQAFQNRQ